MQYEKQLSAPFSITLFITKECNLSCKHCCTEGHLEDEELSFNEILDIIDQFKAAKIFSVQVVGGEPLLRDDLFEILTILKKKQFRILLNTNCTLIDDIKINKLKKVSPIEVRTSLDGSNSTIHDKLRGEGSFERTVEGIKKLIKAGFSLQARAVVTKYNILDLPNIALTAKKLDLIKINFAPVLFSGQAKFFRSELAPDDESYQAGPVIAKELIKRYGSFVSGPFITIFNKIERFKTLKKRKNQRVSKIGLCPAGRTTLAVRPDGVVIPCSPLWDIHAGSIREKPLLEIWKNSPILHKFRTMDKISLDSIDGCRKCSFKYFCNGGCRASAYYFSGSTKGFCPDCNYFREEYYNRIRT